MRDIIDSAFLRDYLPRTHSTFLRRGICLGVLEDLEKHAVDFTVQRDGRILTTPSLSENDSEILGMLQADFARWVNEEPPDADAVRQQAKDAAKRKKVR